MEVNLSSIKARFQFEIEYFEEYLSFNEKALLDRSERLKKDMEEDQYHNSSVPMDVAYKDEIEKIPSLFFSSSILMLFSVLESTLNDICREIIGQCDLPICIEDYSGNNYIRRTKVFLEAFGHIDFKRIDAQWVEISKFQKLRNNIIHKNSIVVTENSSFLTLLGTLGIELPNSNDRYYILNNKPINRLKTNIQQYVSKIIGQAERINYTKFDRPESKIITEPSPI